MGWILFTLLILDLNNLVGSYNFVTRTIIPCSFTVVCSFCAKVLIQGVRANIFLGITQG